MKLHNERSRAIYKQVFYHSNNYTTFTNVIQLTLDNINENKS